MNKSYLLRKNIHFSLFNMMIFLSLTTLLLLGCAEDDFVSNSQEADKYISFTTHVEEMEDIAITRSGEGHYNPAHHHEMTGARVPMYARFTQMNYIGSPFHPQAENAESRGRRIDTAADFYDSFGLISFMYSPSQTWSSIGSTKTPYVYNERVRRADGWRTAEYWPGSGRKLTFFSYAPYNAQGLTLSPSTQTGTPWLHHEVPLDAQDQSDLLISANEHEVGNYNAIRLINFRHICAGVRFGIGSQMAPGTIKKIQLADVYGEGWYHFGEAQWDSVKTEKTFTLNQSFSIAKGESNKLLTTSDNVFMMVPQKVPEYGRIIVTIDDGEEHELVAYIEDDKWDIGTTTTYWLSTLVTDGDTVLSVAVENAPIAATGGTAQYEVGSYYTTAYGTRSPIPWTAYYTIDDDTTKYEVLTPDAVTAFTFSGGSSPTETYNITANKGYPRSVSQNTKMLKRATPQNKDLAIGNGGSANCYVVNAAGTYTFPCVYGNGLDNAGNARPASDYLADNFVNHAGTQINTLSDLPKIPESEIDNVCIVWQDAKSLINPKSLQIVTRNGFKCVQFTIDTLNICQGNAVIAVRNFNTEILWSWHIWVTNHNMSNTIRVDNQNYGNVGRVISDFAPVPLGFCERDTFKYAARKIHLSIVQPSTNDTARITINQNSADAYIYGVNAPYYQFGRKDPFIISKGNNEKKTFYDASYTYGTAGAVSLAEAIKRPYLFYRGELWCTTTHWNLWNLNLTAAANVDATTVKKTVYDPCPAKFTLPKTGAYTGFTNSGTGESGNAYWTTSHAQYGIGSNFPTNSFQNPIGNPSTIFFFALGAIDHYDTGTIKYVGEAGHYWTAGNYSNGWGRYLYFPNNYIDPQDYHGRSYGFSVWPVAE